MTTQTKARRCAALLLAVMMLLTSCGGNNASAATMHLMRTEGTVGVSDDAGKSVAPRENLGLYSGYGVDTRSASYAWINLDDVKLTKMDQNSEIAIRKGGKHLEIEVKSGSLFFNVTEPLADDETMNIRTSTMLVGIRGTCGWVEDNDGLSRVYLLEGKVECSAGDRTVQVSAGEVAGLTEDGELAVAAFTRQDLPAFVLDELGEDDELVQAIPEDSGTDAQPSAPETLPTDGNRIVFTGTVNTYTYDEVLALQGESDPNPDPDNVEHGFIYRLIVLDTPQTMELLSGSGVGSRSGTVSLISVVDVAGMEQYDGQHLIFSIDPSQTMWPSDTSLPLGEPRTDDIHVLGTAPF